MIKIFTRTKKRCLLCKEELHSTLSWLTLLTSEKEQKLCHHCESRFIEIKTPKCEICSRPFTTESEKYRHGKLCYDCYRWENDPRWRGLLKTNQSLFSYDNFLKELFTQFKYRGDYLVAEIFRDELRNQFSQVKSAMIVPIPLSEERYYERGFNQTTALLDVANITYVNALTRLQSEKQAKKTRQERLANLEIFQLTNGDLRGKSIILFDDIYTTGTTLRVAAKLLKEAGAADVSSITIARS